MTTPLPWITRHAIERYIERVDRSASAPAARVRIARILSDGRARSTPRHWMRGDAITPGLRFVYWAEQADICLLVLNGAVLTVLTRALFNRRRQLLPDPGGSVDPIYALSPDLSLPTLREVLEEAA